MSANPSIELTEFTPPDLFRILADETRLRAMVLMHAEGELCVCELTFAIGVSQPKMSRHLGVLRDAGLVRDRRQGIWIHYRLAPDLPAWSKSIMESVCAGLTHDRPYLDDRERLDGMPDRPEGRCTA